MKLDLIIREYQGILTQVNADRIFPLTMNKGKESNGDERPFGNQVCGLSVPSIARIVDFNQPIQNLLRKWCMNLIFLND